MRLLGSKIPCNENGKRTGAFNRPGLTGLNARLDQGDA